MTADIQEFKVSVRELKDEPVIRVFTFVPNGSNEVRRSLGEEPGRIPQYVVRVKENGSAPEFDWHCSPNEPGDAKDNFEDEVRLRLNSRLAWVNQVEKLVAQVELWARELGWDTRKIEKRLDDSFVGKHTVQALLMQMETCRILLEPVGRSAPGAEGLVDLYLLPAYDDIASLFYYQGGWNVHYYFPGDPTRSNIRDTPARPLSKDLLRSVLEEMRANAA